MLAALKPALIVVLVVALILAVVWLGQRRLVYLPDRAMVPPVAGYFPEGRDARLVTSDGLTLGGWYVPAAGAQRFRPAPAPGRGLTVLVAPGNGGNREGRAPLAAALAEAGFAVLLFDYRGYGGNPGRPTEAGLAKDVRAAYDYLVTEQGVRPEQLIYFGESLGGGVVAELATQHPPAGLLLRSPFTDLAAAGAVHYPFLPVRLMLWDRYPVAEYVAEVEVPTAVVYGSRDRIVPPGQSREVAERAAGPTLVTEIPGAGHNDPALFDSPELVAAVVGLAELIGSRP